MEKYINLIRHEINESFAENSHAKWEFLKYAIRKFTITYSKTKAKNGREKKLNLENNLKILEQNSNLQNDKTEYKFCKQELNTIYYEIIAGIKIKSRCSWYEFGEKSNKFF